MTVVFESPAVGPLEHVQGLSQQEESMLPALGTKLSLLSVYEMKSLPLSGAHAVTHRTEGRMQLPLQTSQ